jgi:hypothetical protein
MADETYDGLVGFGDDGVHYPLDDDGELDTSRPLRWVEGSTYRDATGDEPLHNDVHHKQFAGVDMTSLVLHDAGQDEYPIGAHVVSEDAETYYLADEHGNHVDGRPLAYDRDTQTFKAVT